MGFATAIFRPLKLCMQTVRQMLRFDSISSESGTRTMNDKIFTGFANIVCCEKNTDCLFERLIFVG